MTRPKGFWGTFVFIAIPTAITFALLWSALFSLIMGWNFGLVLRLGGIWVGIGFGLIFGFVMAFYMKAMTITMNYEDKTIFTAHLKLILIDLGYRPEIQGGNFLSYKPSVRAGIFSGKISVQLYDDSATIMGPSAYIKKIQSRL